MVGNTTVNRHHNNKFYNSTRLVFFLVTMTQILNIIHIYILEPDSTPYSFTLCESGPQKLSKKSVYPKNLLKLASLTKHILMSTNFFHKKLLMSDSKLASKNDQMLV